VTAEEALDVAGDSEALAGVAVKFGVLGGISLLPFAACV